jgi:dienelactone hydrolase
LSGASGLMNTSDTYKHLGVYSDWVAAARDQLPPRPAFAPSPANRERIRELLGFSRQPAQPVTASVDRTWTADGLAGEEVSWSVGYGPRTRAWVLRPLSAAGPLPAVVALHSHDGFKYFGKEKIADGPDATAPEIVQLRHRAYQGRAFANALAARGFVVLVPDVFLWGSRRFPIESMPTQIRDRPTDPGSIDRYNAAARDHEHLVAKYCSVLGTTLAGVVAYEDRVALAYLKSRGDVVGERIGCVGLSGGGCRAALLQATADDLAAAVIVGMMSTYAGLLDEHVYQHTWMFVPPGLAAVADWPDLAASRAPSPLLVQYNRGDPLFSLPGMQAAHARIKTHYQSVGRPDAYVGEFFDGPHKFDLTMQESAFGWLSASLLA